jgi:hypothetical protein
MSLYPIWKIVYLLFSHFSLASEKWEDIASFTCSNTTMVIMGRSHSPNSSGSHAIEQKFIFNKKEVPFLYLAKYYGNLSSILPQPLQSNSFMNVKNGPTLFLSPKDFSKNEFTTISNCLENLNPIMNMQLQNKWLYNSTFLGLMGTKARISMDGIAQIIFSEFSIQKIFQHSYSQVLLLKDGRVLFLENLNHNGKKLPLLEQVGTWKDKTFYYNPTMLENVKARIEHIKLYEDHGARRFKDLYSFKQSDAK